MFDWVNQRIPENLRRKMPFDIIMPVALMVGAVILGLSLVDPASSSYGISTF